MKLRHQCVWLPAKHWKWNGALPSTTPRLTTVDHGFIQGNFSLKHSKCNLSCELVPSGEILRARLLRGLLKLNYVIELQIPYFVYQCSHRLLPPCFSEYFKFTSSVYSYSTRPESCNRNLYVTSVWYHPIWPTFPKIHWCSPLEFLAYKYN